VFPNDHIPLSSPLPPPFHRIERRRRSSAHSLERKISRARGGAIEKQNGRAATEMPDLMVSERLLREYLDKKAAQLGM
jgi:hypothetical protein